MASWTLIHVLPGSDRRHMVLASFFRLAIIWIVPMRRSQLAATDEPTVCKKQRLIPLSGSHGTLRDSPCEQKPFMVADVLLLMMSEDDGHYVAYIANACATCDD